ncbi:hypothetical protein Cni_G14966 [Canna indica]|uniref:phosphatidylglycerophosphatase n=1 Tax=Canna indica TaxID=4628 RepID=A0AAQ3KCL0_9LILI|nr:hypothetical protein Cni_G14966 [Canna indica]
MHIEELGDRDCEGGGGGEEEKSILGVYGGRIGLVDAKMVAVGVGARVLFYPTLMYNVLRNMIQPEFHWWDRVDEFLLLGAVPFPSDVPRLKQIGVRGVITLNEPFETLVPTSLYSAHGIEHLLIPTRDYLFAPSFEDICQAVEFIHRHTVCGETTYVHCKAGRGRSTTIVLCYLVRHKLMTPTAAYEYVKLIRPRVLLSCAQWKAVEDYYHSRVQKIGKPIHTKDLIVNSPLLLSTGKFVAFDEASFIVVSRSDLDGYDKDDEENNIGNAIWAELRLVYRMQFAGQAALARLSYLWIGCNAREKTSSSTGIPIPVYCEG